MSRPATSRLKVNPVRGSPPTLEWLAIDQLLIDDSYQRQVDTGQSQTLIRRIAQFWDWGLCQPLAVSRRPNGALLIVDGQHRASAAKLRCDIQHLPCVITSYASAGDEAAAFVALNQQRRPLNSLDLFKAALAANDAEATAIMRAITDAGLRLSKHTNYTAWKPGDIANIGGIQRAFRGKGEPVVRVALSALAKSWPNEVLQYGGSVFPGFVAVALDEFRLRGNSRETISELSALAGSFAQVDWRRMGESLVAEKGGGRNEAMETVFRTAWRTRHNPAPITPDFEPEEAEFEGLTWCVQCDRRVSGQQAARCVSPFCSLKAKAA
jgi:hypothetical protein